MAVVFGLGTKLRMRVRLQNGVLRNRQQPGSAVNSFIDQGKFEAVKTLSGRRGFILFTDSEVWHVRCALRNALLESESCKRERGAVLAYYTCYIFGTLYLVYLLYVCNGHYAYYTFN